jgi:glycosyltransferase involved in cell wall biosynthesis
MRVGTAPNPAANAYSSMLYSAVEDSGATVDDITLRKLFRQRYDIVHVHWPEWYLYERPRARMVLLSSIFLAGLCWARVRGAKLVWTAHNLAPHESTPQRYTAWFFSVFTRLVDAVISPTELGIEPLRKRFPRLAHVSTAVIPLGHLRGRFPDHGSRKKARERLGIRADARVACFFGNVRPYKNVPGLVRHFRALADPHVVLLIGGRPLNEDVREQVELAAAGDERVRLHLCFVDDDEVQDYLRAADIVTLPYSESSNSFVALLALSFDRPVLAPAIGGFPELAAIVGPTWVRLYDGALTTGVLDRALVAASVHPPEGAAPDLDWFSWSRIGAATIAVYGSMIGTDSRPSDLGASSDAVASTTTP